MIQVTADVLWKALQTMSLKEHITFLQRLSEEEQYIVMLEDP